MIYDIMYTHYSVRLKNILHVGPPFHHVSWFYWFSSLRTVVQRNSQSPSQDPAGTKKIHRDDINN